MHPATILALTAVRAADRVSPELAGRLAMPLFRQVRPSLPVRPGDRAVHEAAERGTITVRGREVVTYAWGHGARTVLVVHGWRGRAAQFGPIVRELRSEGLRVIAFDAPANGDSAGRHTDIRDFIAAIDELQRRHGMFRAIVGHSFGALAALTAVREGTATGGVVAIAGMADARYLVDLAKGNGVSHAELLEGLRSVTMLFPTIPIDDATVAVQTRKTTTPERAARDILHGMECNAYRVLIGRDAKLMDVLYRLTPRRSARLIADRMKDLLGR